MKQILTLFVMVLLLAGSGCALISGTEVITSPTSTSSPVVSLTLEESAEKVIEALAARDMAAVAALVHPHQGVRFSPYAYVREEHQVFMAAELTGLMDSDEIFFWGQYDGTGDPIELTFEDYYEEFVYSADFASADQVAVNERLGQGNTIHNISEFYPGSSFVEYHIPGSEEFGGMDWESLRLVFVEEGDAWMLVGIVHDEWTI